MENWNRLIERIAANGGVGTAADARAAGVSESTWHRRTRLEEWGRPYVGVRVAPWALSGRVTELRAALVACRGHAAAAGTTALWLDGLRDEPHVLSLVVPAGVWTPRRDPDRVRLSVARWLTDDDIREVDGIGCLRPEPLVVSLSGMGRGALMGAVIDLVQAGRTTPDRVLERLAKVGPVRGRGNLEAVLVELGGKRPESWFHDVVLAELDTLGYPVSHEPGRVDTPDGRGLLMDIPIGPFRVGVDPQGDRFHRGAGPRRSDRRRVAQLAGTAWVIVPVDWRDWHQRRAWVLETIDAAILRQLRAGIGTSADLPPHLREADAS